MSYHFASPAALDPRILPVSAKVTTSSFTGVPANSLRKFWMPPLIVCICVAEIEPEVSTTIPMLPPQRERAAVNVGAPVRSSVDRSASRFVPPALRKIWL